MSKSTGRRLDVICYIEGYKIPLKSISISCQLGMPSIATIEIPPAQTAPGIYPTSHVVVFALYGRHNDDRPIKERYMLMFHGEVSSTRTVKNGINISQHILAVDSRAYLNRLPSRMLWSMYKDPGYFFPTYSKDAAFYGIPESDAMKAHFEGLGVLVEKSETTLPDFVQRILSLLKYNEYKSIYNYYANAEYRFNIKGNHSVVDYGDSFKTIWGALYKNSLIKNTTQSIVEYNGTTMDALGKNIDPLGYVYLSTVFPRYIGSGSKAPRLSEYMITRDTINHQIPRFNYILIDREDNLNTMLTPPVLTALKYKYKIDANTYPIEDHMYPANAMEKGKFKMTDEEAIYGVARESLDMDYYYNAFLKDQADGKGDSYYKSGGRKTVLTKKIAYDYIVRRMSRNGISVAKNGFYPYYILGYPAAVYDPLSGRAFRGNISRISYYVSMEQGRSVTTAELVNADSLAKRRPEDTMDWQEINKDRDDHNPLGGDEFIKEQESFYREHYYDDKNAPVMLRASDISRDQMDLDQYESIIKRPICSMKEYLSMLYGEASVPDDSVPDDLYGEYVNSGGAGVMHYKTFNENAEIPYSTYKGNKMNLMFIEERRARVVVMQEELKGVILYA